MIAEASAEIVAILREDLIERGVQVHPVLSGAAVEPPCVVVGIPILEYDANRPQLRMYIAVVVDANEQALTKLSELLPLVVETLEDVTNLVVVRAEPGAFPSGTVALPCYEIECEVNP